MLRRLSAIAASVLLCAQSPIANFPPGTFGNRAALSPATVAFQGPGDIVSGAVGWYSCARAYSAAFAAGAGAICDVVDSATGLASCTLKTGINGFADLTSNVCVGNTVSVTTFCTITNVACKVTKAYDQSGTGNPVVQATLAAMPTFTLNALNSLPCMTFVSASSQQLTIGTTVPSQPFTLSTVAKRTGGTSSFAGAITGNANGIGWLNSTNTMILFAGSSGSFSASDNTFHAVQGVFNGASSVGYVDGSSNTVNPGAGGMVASIKLGNLNGSFLDGQVCEGGAWSGAWNVTQYGNVNTNQHGANGYNF